MLLTITTALLYTLAPFPVRILHILIQTLLARFADPLAALASTLPFASAAKDISLSTTLESACFLVLQVHLSSSTPQQT